MKTKFKPPVLPALCRAVKAIRKASGWSQEKMAQETGLSHMTLSRFERGVQIPRNTVVLMRLFEAANNASLEAEAKVFSDALAEAPPVIWRWRAHTEIETALSQIRAYKDHPSIRVEYIKVLRALLRAHQVLAYHSSEGLKGKSAFYADLLETARAQTAVRKELEAIEGAMKRKHE